MAVFKEPWENQRLDWAILQNSPVALYWSEELLQKDLEWFRGEQYGLVELRCSTWTSITEALVELGEALRFPSYYGVNLDALNDCLSDLEIRDDSGLTLVLHELDSFVKREPDNAHTILDVLASNSRLHLLFGRRFIVLAQSNDPDLQLAPVGACPVLWNPQEFLRRKRAKND